MPETARQSRRPRRKQQVVQYFQGLADRYKGNPAARSRILFRLASLTAEKDPAKALADMKAAYDPNVCSTAQRTWTSTARN